MKFSLITVCRNAVHCLDKTIQSVAVQSYSDWEYLIIDGQSEDHTQDVIQPYLEQGIVHTFISEPDSGVYAAMNKGLNRASGEYIYFLNADDCLLDAEVLQDIATELQRHSDCDLLYGNIVVIPENDKSQQSVIYPAPSDLLNHLMHGWLCHQAMVVRAELFKEVGCFDTRFKIAADYDWLLRALSQNITVYSVDREIASYTLGGLSDTYQIESLQEMFAIQNEFPAYQTQQAFQQRIQKLQTVVLDNHIQIQTKQKRLQHLRSKNQTLKLRLDVAHETIETLNHCIAEAQRALEESQLELKAIETSKFWNVRSLWFSIRNRLLSLVSQK